VTCTNFPENGLETFRAKSVEISLMTIYLQPHCIEYSRGQEFWQVMRFI